MNTRSLLSIVSIGILTLIAPGKGARSSAEETDEETMALPPGWGEAMTLTPAHEAMYRGVIYAQERRFDRAIPELEAAIREEPSLLGAWETLGWSYWITGRPQAAEELWTRLINMAPDEPLGYNLLAQVAIQGADLQRARALYETSLELNPDQYEIRVNYARMLLWSGDATRAAVLLRQLLREDPDRIDVEIELAWARYVDEEYEEVLEHWNRINEEIPDNPGFLLARANVLLLMGSLDEAEADARRALDIDPQHAAAVDLLAMLALHGRRPKEAVEVLRRVMEFSDDTRTQAHVAARIATYMKSVYDTGAPTFSRTDILHAIRESLDLHEDDIGVLLFHGEMLLVDHQFAQAADVFQRVLDTYNPHNSRAIFGLLETYFGRTMYDEAEHLLRETFRYFNPNNPFRHAYWARLHLYLGRFDDAMDALDRMEYEGTQGAVFTLLYHGINPSETSDMPSVRQFREHMMTLHRDGFGFIRPSDLEPYFEQKKPAALTDARPRLYRHIQSMHHALTGIPPDKPMTLLEYTPEKRVMVTFDDGLRNSFRHGTRVAGEMGIPLTMFIGVGDSFAPMKNFIASFPEIRDYLDTGLWEMHSHAWDGGELAEGDEDGRPVLPMSNLLWLPDRGRMETLREFHTRLRKEFRESRLALLRELDLSENDVFAVAYPYGEVGQETESNIRAFNVPEVVLNEASMAYRMGFIQHQHGYTMKTDDPMLYKRWEPDRYATGRDVLREAYRQHPVFTARRMRAEMAAYRGELHMALSNIARLKRDGYPEEDLAALNELVRRQLARLAPLPEGVEDITGRDTPSETPVSFRKPHIGVEGRITRANEMIDDRDVSLLAGIHLNPRLSVQVRAGEGRIQQTVRTIRFEREVVSPATETEPAVLRSVRVEDAEFFEADKYFAGLSLNYTHAGGSFTIGQAHFHSLDGPSVPDKTIVTYNLEHHWRPVLALDLNAWYRHGLTPSARKIITYDAVGAQAFWRIRDYWHADGLTNFAYINDRNSLVRAQVENYWRLSRPNDVWIGHHHSLETMDRDSDLYWAPYWDQRHYGFVRLRRAYPNYYGLLRFHFGVQKSRARREEREEFAQARVQGEIEGWSPGLGPQQGWEKLIGFSGAVTRTFSCGFEITGEFSVTASGEYTEHAATLRLMQTF